MDDAEQLLAVRIDLDVIADLYLEIDTVLAIDGEQFGHVLDQRPQRQETAVRLGLRRAAVGKDFARIADGAVDGAEQCRREALDHGIVDIGQAIGNELCGDRMLRMS